MTDFNLVSIPLKGAVKRDVSFNKSYISFSLPFLEKAERKTGKTGLPLFLEIKEGDGLKEDRYFLHVTNKKSATCLPFVDNNVIINETRRFELGVKIPRGKYDVTAPIEIEGKIYFRIRYSEANRIEKKLKEAVNN